MNEDYRLGYRQGYEDGRNSILRSEEKPTPVTTVYHIHTTQQLTPTFPQWPYKITCTSKG